VIAVKATEQHLRGGAAKSCGVLSDHRDAGLEEIGQQEVIESDQANPIVQSQFSQAAECADRDQVLAGEQGSWRTLA
jgi:hypothetical protein